MLQARSALRFTSPSGAHALTGAWRGATFRYTTISALPGDARMSACESGNSPVSTRHGEVAVTGCAGLAADAAGVARDLEAARTWTSALLGTPHTVSASVELVRPGRERVTARSFSWRDSSPLEFSIALRHPRADGPHRRSAVRIFTHELTHLLLQAGQVARHDEEYVASMMESCVELEVFGNTRGYAFPEELAPAADAFSRSQKASVAAGHRAFRDVSALLQGARPEDALRATCKRLTSST
jgi:hypothetical protein